MTRDHAQREREAFLAFCDGTLIQERAVAPEGETLNTWRDELNPRFTGGYEHRLKPMLAPSFDRCECGHSWGQHLAKGCTHWTEGSGYCSCRRPSKPKAMVPLGQEDVNLHLDLFRFREGEQQVATTTTRNEIWIGSGPAAMRGMNWKDAQRLLHRSVDGGLTWQRCEKEEK